MLIGQRAEEMADDEGQEKDDKKDRGQSPRRLGLKRDSCWQPGKQFPSGPGGSRCRIQTEKDSILES